MPLNQLLYDRLGRRFGAVLRICKAGEAAAASVIISARSNTSRPYVRTLSGGEEYIIRCPFCENEHNSGHLYVNYRYGTIDAAGRECLSLATCFRRDCLSSADNRRDLSEMIYGNFASDLQRAPVKINWLPPGAGVKKLTKIDAPPIVPLTSLEPGHPVLAYLRQRSFDPVELANEYSVGVAVQPCPYQMEGRIYCPVFMRGFLVGYQGRWPAELPKESNIPKYWNLPTMAKRLMLYNFDRAKDCDQVVVVEGVTDVWRVGQCGVAMFGKKASPEQETLLVENWGAKTIFLLPDGNDPDAPAKARELQARLLSRCSGRVILAELEEVDPGATSREALWDLLQAAAS